MGPRVVRVVIAGGRTLLRSTLCTLLAHEDALTVIGQPSDGDTAVALVRRSQPDVVLPDLEKAAPRGGTDRGAVNVRRGRAPAPSC